MGIFAEQDLLKREEWDDDNDLSISEPAEIEESESVLPQLKQGKNLVTKVISNNQEKGKRIIKNIPIPRAFDLEYYQKKLEDANFQHDKDAIIKFSAIKRYADIVYEFYKNVMYAFNVKNNILDMPEYIKLTEIAPCDIDRLAETMQEREKTLIKVYGNSANVITAFNKRKHLTELKTFSAQAWLMYYNLKNLNDFIGYLIFIQNCNNSADETNPSHIANLYGLHVQTGYYLDANIKNFFNAYNNGFLVRKNPATAGIYSDLNSFEQFDILVKEKHGYCYKENHERIVEKANSIPDNTKEKRIVGFYKYYRDMKYIKHKLKHIYIAHKDSTTITDDKMFIDSNNPNLDFVHRDVYKVGIKYYTACKSLVESLPIKSKIYRDICDMCVEFEEILLLNQEMHKQCEEERIKRQEQLRKEFPQLAEKIKNNNPNNGVSFIENDQN